MAHRNDAELSRMIEDASRDVCVGADYVHYKDETHRYRVTGFAVIEATDELGVLYQPLYGDLREAVTFVRPLSSWLETVEHEGLSIPRFNRATG